MSCEGQLNFLVILYCRDLSVVNSNDTVSHQATFHFL